MMPTSLATFKAPQAVSRPSKTAESKADSQSNSPISPQGGSTRAECLHSTTRTLQTWIAMNCWHRCGCTRTFLIYELTLRGPPYHDRQSIWTSYLSIIIRYSARPRNLQNCRLAKQYCTRQRWRGKKCWSAHDGQPDGMPRYDVALQ